MLDLDDGGSMAGQVRREALRTPAWFLVRSNRSLARLIPRPAFDVSGTRLSPLSLYRRPEKDWLLRGQWEQPT